MGTKNIQMKNYNEVTEEWDNLNPVTTPENIRTKQGKNLSKILDGIGVTVDAVGDGVTDDTQAFKDAIAELKRIGGTRLFINSGKYVISEPIIIDINGISIQGTPYYTMLYASPTFTGEHLLKFVNDNGRANVTGLHVEGIHIKMEGRSGHGITVVNGYQFVTMKNVEILNVHGSYSAFNFTYESGNNIAGQTVLLENIYGAHAVGGKGANTKAIVYMNRYQEVVLVGCKALATHHTDNVNINGVCFHFEDSRGIALYGCSVAFGDTGILFESKTRAAFGLTVSGLTSEQILGNGLYGKSWNGITVGYIVWLPLRPQSGGGSVRIENGANNLVYGLLGSVTITGNGSRNIVYSGGENNVDVPDGNMVWKIPEYGYDVVGLENNMELAKPYNPYIALKVKGQDHQMRLRLLADQAENRGFEIERKVDGVWQKQIVMSSGGYSLYGDAGEFLARIHNSASLGYTNLTVLSGSGNASSRVKLGGADSGGSGMRALTVDN